MRKFLITIFTLTMLFSSSLIYSQESESVSVQDSFFSEFVPDYWTTADGLPGNTVTDILQSAGGYVYLGTYDGLVRFDGVQFDTFNRRTEEKYTFVAARTVFEDSKENLWIGTNDEGVRKITPLGEIEEYTIEKGLPNKSIRSICEDKEENIWIGTTSGVAIVDKTGNVRRFTELEKFGAANLYVTNIYCDTAGRVWILSQDQNGVYVYSNNELEKFKGLAGFKNPVITCITQDANADFWLGVEPYYAVKLSGEEETVYDVGHGELPGSTVHYIFQDKNGYMWIARDSGVSVLHNGSWSYLDSSNLLRNDNIVKIMQDREGNIWFATDRGGIEKLTPAKFRTTTMKTTINAIAEDTTRGLVWLAGDNGLYCLKNRTFVENELTKACSNVRIRDVTVSYDGTVLVSVYEKPTEVIMTPEDKIYSLSQDDGLAGYKARIAIKTRNGDLYIGTTSGLSIVNGKTGKIRNFGKADGLANEFIMCIYEDMNGEIWCGTDGGGIFSVKNGELASQYSTADGLIGNIVFKIMETSKGDYWITTGTGISRMKLDEGVKFINYNSTLGLGADGIFQLVPDYTGTVWMTSNRGVSSANIKDFDAFAEGRGKRVEAKFYGRSDGLISGGVTSTSKSMRDSFGRIWFTLIDGFSVYDPLNISANKTAPLVNIERITIDNEIFDWHGKKLELKPGTNRIDIKFTGLSFISSKQTTFKTKLEGFDKDYSDWSTQRNVSYTNLPHGKYEFSVIACNSDGVESAAAKTFVLVKKPYFYEVIWFWIGVAIVVIAAVFLSVRHKIMKMKRYQIKLEKAVDDRTRELKAEKERAENLLLNILPKEIADELESKADNQDKTIAHNCNNATVLFADIQGFTKMSDSLEASEVVAFLNQIVTRFDERASREGIEKIKTMGDAYMAATGLEANAGSESTLKMVKFAQGMLSDLREFNLNSKVKVNMRIGIHSGKVVSGVIGKSKFIFDIWGDTVNVASRMESNGEAGKICVTEHVYNIAKDYFIFSGPREVNVKGKGIMNSYLTE